MPRLAIVPTINERPPSQRGMRKVTSIVTAEMRNESEMDSRMSIWAMADKGGCRCVCSVYYSHRIPSLGAATEKGFLACHGRRKRYSSVSDAINIRSTVVTEPLVRTKLTVLSRISVISDSALNCGSSPRAAACPWHQRL